MDPLMRHELRIGRLHLGIAIKGASPLYGWNRIIWRLWFKVDQKLTGKIPD